MAAAASVAYDDQVYESPPNVAEAPASEGHTLSTEEFDETPSAPKTNSFMPIKDAIIEASKSEKLRIETIKIFSNFSPAAEDRQTFGPGNSEAYVWQSASVLMTETISGTITSYTGGGFLLQLPLDDPTKARTLLEGVKSNRWIDRGTRAIIIDFSMFNANSNLFSIARLLLELPASGGVLPSYRFNTYNLMRYYGSFGNVLIILEGILVGFIIFYIFEKILELIRLRLRYFGKFWDIVDIVLLTLCSCEVYFNYRRLTIAANRINTSLKSGLTVAAFDEVVSTQETFNNIAAVVLFLSWIKVQDAE
uniref:Polycystin cation channel domain containing protein n=1 Tax=Haemonchus contortus TaxID=6289 RepID=W6NCG4_HAECO